MSSQVRIGIVGSQFQADTHAAATRMGSHRTVAAVASPPPGRVARQLTVAGYHSAGSRRAVELPFRPSGVAKPIDLWFHPIED